MSDNNVNLSLSDPVSADIQAIAKAVEEVFKFAQTPEGQAACKAWREGTVAITANLQKAGQWVEDLFTGKPLKG